jgi:hypothetical protein
MCGWGSWRGAGLRCRRGFGGGGWRGEFGKEGCEVGGGERVGLAVEIVNSQVAEVLDICTELVCCGCHRLIVAGLLALLKTGLLALPERSTADGGGSVSPENE